MLAERRPLPEMEPQGIQGEHTQKRSLLFFLKQIWDSIRITLFVVGTALIVFVAARNTVTWHVQHFWGASADFWQRRWKWIYDAFGGDEFNIGIWGTVIVANGVFWLFNSFLLFLDATGKPEALLKYKIQEDKQVPVDRKKLKKALLVVLFNSTVMSVPVYLGSYYVMSWRGCSFSDELPSFHWVVFEIFVFTMVEEVMFYYSHRLFHHRLLYKHIHKVHHEWTAPIGIIGIYAHPIEHLISNIIPPVMGPILMGSHIATAWLWYALALMSTSVAHSGYHLPFLPSPEAHDFHHKTFTNNFGVMGILDRLHNTDNLFRLSKAYQRHFLLIGFTPMTEQFPDDHKRKKSE